MACFFSSSEDKEQIETLQKEILVLKRELITIQQTNIEREREALSSDSDDDEPNMPQTHEGAQQLQNIKQQLEDSRAKIKHLEKQLQDKQNTIDESKAENEMLKASQLALKQNNNAKDEPDAIKPIINDLNAQLLSLQAANQMLQRKLTETHPNTEKYRTEIEGLSNENEALKSQINALKTETKRLLNKNEPLTLEINALKTKNKNVSDELEKRKEEIEKLSNENKPLILEINALQMQHKNASDDLQKRNKEIERLSNENKPLTLEINALKTQNKKISEDLETRNEEIERLSNENNSLTLEMSALKTQNKNISDDAEKHKKQIEKLVLENKQQIKLLVAQNKNIAKENEAIKKEKEIADKKLLKATAFQQQILLELEEKEKDKNDKDDKEKSKIKTKKGKITDTADQIRIAMSESAKIKSLLLCCKPQTVNKDGKQKEFGFVKFLQTNLNDKVVNQLFGKFKKEELDAAQLLSILTLTVLIYKVKLHQLQTADSKKPKLDSNKIKQMVEHLAVYIVRKYGMKKNDKEDVCVEDDDGNAIKGQFYGYTFVGTKNIFAANVSEWIETYVADDGNIDIV